MSATAIQTTTLSTKPVTKAKKNVLSFEGSQSIHHAPKFTDKYAEREFAKQQMAGAFRIFANLGWADGGAGHISLRDPINPNQFWINPYAKHFGLIKVSDLILVNEGGEAVEPTTQIVNAAGFVIHSSIHRARPDVNVAIHLHSPHGRAWSVFGKPVEMLTQDSCYFYDDLAIYEGFGGAAIATEEGKRIAEALGPKKKTVILQNHGLLTCGESVGEAAAFFIALERACQTQLLSEAAAANGIQKRFIDDKEASYTKSLFSPGFMYMQFVPEYELALKTCNGDFLG